MQIEIIIPSKDRITKLDNCLNSIFRSFISTYKIKIRLYLSSQEEINYYSGFFEHCTVVETHLLPEYRVPNFWNNCFKNSNSDILFYLNDDIEVFEDTIHKAVKALIINYPDLDGIVGINQININSKDKVPAAFGAIGKKYLERFPEKQLFCPDYSRFYGDYEIWQYAKEINKFIFCSESRVNHYHPCIDSKYMDSTHSNVRKWLPLDRETFRQRKERNLLWGRNFDLINIKD